MFRRLTLFALLGFACDGTALAAPPPLGSVQMVKVIACDGAETGTTRLTTVTVTGFPNYATQAWVVSVGDWFVHKPATAAAQALVVVPASDGRQWVRQFVPNPAWRDQLTWSIDESNATGLASDENTCADDTHPCLTIDEFIRRAKTLGRYGTTVVHWLSNTTHIQVNLAPVTPTSTVLPLPEAYPVIVFQGIPTVLQAGTLTGATDAPWTVTDSTLPTSWTASGLVSSSTGTRIIRKTDLTKHAFIGYENSARTAQTSPTNGYLTPATTWLPFGTAAASFSNGDAYEVLSLPKFPRVTPTDYSAAYGATVFTYLDMDGILGGQVEIRNCGFPVSFPDLNASTRSGVHQFHGAIFVQGVSITAFYASNSIARAMFLGNSAMGSYNGIMEGNVVAKAGWLSFNHASNPRLGTVYAYDNTANPAIQATNNSHPTITALHGSGNTGVLVDARDPGCSFNSRSVNTAFDATTSALKPITVVGVGKDYADLPFWDTNHNAGFATN